MCLNSKRVTAEQGIHTIIILTVCSMVTCLFNVLNLYSKLSIIIPVYLYTLDMFAKIIEQTY